MTDDRDCDRAYKALAKLLGADHDHDDDAQAYLNLTRAARLVLDMLHDPYPDPHDLYAPTGVLAELSCIACARAVALACARIAGLLIMSRDTPAGREAAESFLYRIIAHGLDQAQPR